MIVVVRVADLAEQVRGVSYGKEDASANPRPGYLPILRAGNISDQGLIFDDLVFVPAERISEKQRIRKDDVVIAASSGSIDVVGKAARAVVDYEGGFGAFCKVLRPGPMVDAAYFAHFFRTPEYRLRASALASGANINNLRNEHLNEMVLPLPPLPRQRQISEILDKANALVIKRHAALAELGSLTQSVFLDMFGDPITNPLGWPTTKLSKLGSLDRGVSKHRPRNAPELLGGPYPFVQTGDVANSDGYIRDFASTYSEAGLRQSKMWPAGTLCITIAANIAKTGILTFDACFPDSVVGFSADEPATVEFVRGWLWFLQSSLEDKAPESAQKNINLKVLRNLDVPVPDVNHQREFARRIAAVESLKKTNRNALTELDALFASLQQRAFHGEL